MTVVGFSGVFNGIFLMDGKDISGGMDITVRGSPAFKDIGVVQLGIAFHGAGHIGSRQDGCSGKICVIIIFLRFGGVSFERNITILLDATRVKPYTLGSIAGHSVNGAVLIDLIHGGIIYDCEIAVGTTYNYFNSKVDLANAVISEDWSIALQNAEFDDISKVTIEEAFMKIYTSICDFYGIYGGVIVKHRHQNSSIDLVKEHHDDFVSDITKHFKTIIREFGYNEPESFLRLLAETTLAAAIHDIDEYEYEELITRVLAVTKQKKRR